MSPEPRSAAEGKTIFCYNDMTSSFKCSITIKYSIVHLMHSYQGKSEVIKLRNEIVVFESVQGQPHEELCKINCLRTTIQKIMQNFSYTNFLKFLVTKILIIFNIQALTYNDIFFNFLMSCNRSEIKIIHKKVQSNLISNEL